MKTIIAASMILVSSSWVTSALAAEECPGYSGVNLYKIEAYQVRHGWSPFARVTCFYTDAVSCGQTCPHSKSMVYEHIDFTKLYGPWTKLPTRELEDKYVCTTFTKDPSGKTVFEGTKKCRFVYK